MTSFDIIDPSIGVPQVHYTGPIFDVLVFLFVMGVLVYAVKRFFWDRFVGGPLSTLGFLISWAKEIFTKSNNR